MFRSGCTGNSWRLGSSAPPREKLLSATRPSLRVLLYAALFLIVSLSANAQSKVSSDGRVVISGHLSREVGEIPEEHNSGTAEKIEFLITVENRGAAPILNVHLDELKADGFVIVNRCWGANFNPDSCGKQTRRSRLRGSGRRPRHRGRYNRYRHSLPIPGATGSLDGVGRYGRARSDVRARNSGPGQLVRAS